MTITFVQLHFSVNKDCLRQKNCTQLCRQTEGGAVCFCKPGYSLDSDGITCNGKCQYHNLIEDPQFNERMEDPQFNEPLFNENLDTTNGILCPIKVKYMKKNLDITNPQFNKRIWPVPSDFVKTRFHCIVIS